MRRLRIFDFRILIVLLTVLVGAGCTHSRTALRSSGGYATVNEQASKSSVESITLILAGREPFSVGELELTPDTVYWSRTNGAPRESAPAEDLRRVRITNSNRGARDGLLVGLASGFVSGVTSLFFVEDEYLLSDEPMFTAEEQAAFIGVAVGLVGVIVGGGIGYLRGSTYVYRFASESPDEDRSGSDGAGSRSLSSGDRTPRFPDGTPR